MSQKLCVQAAEVKVRPKKVKKERCKPEPPRDTFQVVVLCRSEEEQERLYDEFRARNLQVRLLTM